MLNEFRDKLLDYRTCKVCQHIVRSSVAFDDPAPRAVAAQIPFVPKGTWFHLATRDHFLRDALEHIELSLMDGEFDQKMHLGVSHAGLLVFYAMCRGAAPPPLHMFGGFLGVVVLG